jgi:hypothetical protein
VGGWVDSEGDSQGVGWRRWSSLGYEKLHAARMKLTTNLVKFNIDIVKCHAVRVKLSIDIVKLVAGVLKLHVAISYFGIFCSLKYKVFSY